MQNYPTAHGEVSRIAGQRDDAFRFITVMGRIFYWITIPSREIGRQEVLP
jgi:hypothetical protein